MESRSLLTCHSPPSGPPHLTDHNYLDFNPEVKPGAQLQFLFKLLDNQNECPHSTLSRSFQTTNVSLSQIRNKRTKPGSQNQIAHPRLHYIRECREQRHNHSSQIGLRANIIPMDTLAPNFLLAVVRLPSEVVFPNSHSPQTNCPTTVKFLQLSFEG